MAEKEKKLGKRERLHTDMLRIGGGMLTAEELMRQVQAPRGYMRFVARKGDRVKDVLATYRCGADELKRMNPKVKPLKGKLAKGTVLCVPDRRLEENSGFYIG